MKLELAYYGDPILRKKALPVEVFDEKLKELAYDMEETMISTKGIGLAAPQVHQSIRLFLINWWEKDEEGEYHPGTTHFFVNPKILEVSDETWTAGEGCLSIPKLYGDVSRPVSIKVEAQDLDGHLFQAELKGWEAKIFMHENDHINGVLFIDRLPAKIRKEMEADLNSIKRKFYLNK